MALNKSKLLLKVAGLIALAILGVNVYRTEQVSQKLESIAKDTPSFIVSEGTVLPEDSSLEGLSAEIARLQSIVSSQQRELDELKGNLSRVSGHNPPPRPANIRDEGPASSSPAGDGNESAEPRKFGRVRVGVIVRVENRYVDGRTVLPNVSTAPEGQVVVNVDVNNIGTVAAVSISPESTIKDEQILEECKVAALKTNFGLNNSAPAKSSGTITYTFTAR